VSPCPAGHVEDTLEGGGVADGEEGEGGEGEGEEEGDGSELGPWAPGAILGAAGRSTKADVGFALRTAQYF